MHVMCVYIHVHINICMHTYNCISNIARPNLAKAGRGKARHLIREARFSAAARLAVPEVYLSPRGFMLEGVCMAASINWWFSFWVSQIIRALLVGVYLGAPCFSVVFLY